MQYTGSKKNEVEKLIRLYIKQGQKKLGTDLAGTKEAVKLIADDNVRDFIVAVDRILENEERDFLKDLIVTCMYKSFCYGYGIGKVEGKTNKRIYL
jgi:hypothetical protein